MKRVIFFCNQIFTERDYKRFGIDIIKRRGYEVEIWNFIPYLNPEYFLKYNNNNTFSKICKEFSTNQQINNNLSTLSNNDVIIDNFQLADKFTDKEISKRKQPKYGAHLTGMLPLPISEKGLKRILQIYNNNIENFSNLIPKIISRIKGRFNYQNQQALDFLITGGTSAATNNSFFPVNNSTEIIHAHAMDYDIYLNEEKINNHLNNMNTDYAIFIDGNIFDAPDYDLLDLQPYCDSDNYYPKLNKFFNYFEQSTNLEIIIAGNPKANIEERGNPYNGRKIIYGNTCHLVKLSKIVIVEMSTAVNFAVLYKKPVIFIETGMFTKRFRSMIQSQAKALNSMPLNFDRPTDYFYEQILNSKYDKQTYQDYNNKYIKEIGTPKKPTWEIFCDYLD